METNLRNQLRNTITACRKLLEQEYARQLEGHFGIRADGAVEPIENLPHLDSAGIAERRTIEAALQHELNYEENPAAAVERFLRESAFTMLNRLTALKLMEHPGRSLIEESLSQGPASKGFKQFQRISPSIARAEADGGYRLYLELLFDDLGHALGVLFDRSQPQSILFPNPQVLIEILEKLNDPTLEAVWLEDETIGWTYQYFTPKEQRDQARAESSAPRNSYELAFLNQFYTPRYVVAFLSDNTLGKTWYEMRKGDTRLVDQCEYMLRPPDEPIFEREKRDPRTLRVLDPACGSGHFLLYCFDLLRTIYDEAYDDPDLGLVIQADYPEKAKFLKHIPRMIIEHNLHGIDIDLRATQIAAMALWMRAQGAWGEMVIPAAERPTIRKTNVVCAEPMPGDQAMLGEFLRDLKPAILGNLVREVWEGMQLAGEAGSLLKIEQELRESIAKSKKAWESAPEAVQLDLFGGRKLEAIQRKVDLSEIKEGEFWEEAEESVLETLRVFTENGRGASSINRSLFTDDAIQGFSFIDLLKEPYDVILMNPPFGASVDTSKEYLRDKYPDSYLDLYACFIERALEISCNDGLVGAITNRVGFFIRTFSRWRTRIILSNTLKCFADLGYGVLDTAMVETAAYVIQKQIKHNSNLEI